MADRTVRRNVALLVDPPRGTAGRPSTALTADQAARLLAAAEADKAMRANVVVSLLTGARTEELWGLTWTTSTSRGTTDRRAMALGAGRRGDQDTPSTRNWLNTESASARDRNSVNP
jgi:integrase